MLQTIGATFLIVLRQHQLKSLRFATFHNVSTIRILAPPFRYILQHFRLFHILVEPAFSVRYKVLCSKWQLRWNLCDFVFTGIFVLYQNAIFTQLLENSSLCVSLWSLCHKKLWQVLLLNGDALNFALQTMDIVKVGRRRLASLIMRHGTDIPAASSSFLT